jgi:hypothetical protein
VCVCEREREREREKEGGREGGRERERESARARERERERERAREKEGEREKEREREREKERKREREGGRERESMCVCVYTTHHLLEPLPIKLGGLGEVLAGKSQTSVLQYIHGIKSVYSDIQITTPKGNLQNPYLAIFGDDVEVVEREMDI